MRLITQPYMEETWLTSIHNVATYNVPAYPKNPICPAPAIPTCVSDVTKTKSEQALIIHLQLRHFATIDWEH